MLFPANLLASTEKNLTQQKQPDTHLTAFIQEYLGVSVPET